MAFGRARDNASMTVYECAVCGAVGRCGVETEWYGSLADEENGTLDCVCSATCKAKYDPSKKKRARYSNRLGF